MRASENANFATSIFAFLLEDGFLRHSGSLLINALGFTDSIPHAWHGLPDKCRSIASFVR